ncbi:MAG: glycine cleavage system protein H [Mariniblastus sp.]|nr:glycine cleavage system protein H [Mariniblastus sp.]
MIDGAANNQNDEMLTFMMGEFEAEFPTDRLYAKNHMWATVANANGGDQPVALESSGTSKFRFGFTAYAVRLLQDVYFLDWMLEAPAVLSTSQEIGSIESKKAESALFAPVDGQLIKLNELLMEDPSAINTDKYTAGWLFEMQAEQPEFLTATQYIELLDEVWAKTQRTIKGQLNE